MEIPRVLVPITEVSAEEAAKQVHELVSQQEVRKMLLARHLVGVVARHSKDIADSIASMKRAQSLHAANKMAIMAVMSSAGDVVGMATADPTVKLRKQRDLVRRLPPAATSWPFSKRIKGVSPNVAAWTNEELVSRYVPGLLKKAYGELASRRLDSPAYVVHVGSVTHGDSPLEQRLLATKTYNPWTIEPGYQNSPVHMAIEQAGLKPRENGWFDDNEDRANRVPSSTLFALKDHL